MKKEERAEESKNRILLAAESIFSAKGLAGARVDEIAAAARINKRMIYHYFQNKENLYLEVLRNSFSKIYELGVETRALNGTAYEKTVHMVTRYFYFLAENPEFVRLITWETLESGKYARRALSGYLEGLYQEMGRIFADGVAEGTFRRDTDIKKLIVSVNALCLMYFSRREMTQDLWQQDMTEPEMLEAWLQHILELLFCGVLAQNCAEAQDFRFLSD